MATNKRTDSAALFELIDKSTLKVPKTAGSLKIPAWWSSKTNPASVPAATPPPARPAPKPVETAAAAPLDPAAPAVAKPREPVAAAPSPPSIRPPSRPMAPPPAKRPSSGVFAPQTHDQSAPVEGQTRGAPPVWLILAGASALVVILVCVVVAVMRSNHPTLAPSSPGGPEPTPPVGTTFIPVPDPTPGPDPIPPAINQGQPPPQPPAVAGQARVVPFDEVKRVPSYVYLFIFTGNEKAAQANAQYLADHGVSTCVKATNQGKYFGVFSVEGFPNLADPKCEALRKQVVKLGRSHPDAKKMGGKGVYDSAYFDHIVVRP